MTQRITVFVVIAAVALFLTISATKAWAQEWWEPTFHLDNRTAEQKAADEKEQEEWLAEHQQRVDRINCLKNMKTEYVPAGACGTPTFEERLQMARERTQEAELNAQLMNSTVMTNLSQKRTVDDGYVYSKNATEEEKRAIDAQELKAWEEAGRPGEKAEANPYCDLLSSEERSNVTCHDRKDASDVTGLYTCNDGTHKEDWRDCRDVSGYEYVNAEEAGR